MQVTQEFKVTVETGEKQFDFVFEDVNVELWKNASVSQLRPKPILTCTVVSKYQDDVPDLSTVEVVSTNGEPFYNSVEKREGTRVKGQWQSAGVCQLSRHESRWTIQNNSSSFISGSARGDLLEIRYFSDPVTSEVKAFNLVAMVLV